MFINIILLWFTSISAAPIQLKYTQPLDSFQTPQVSVEFTEISNENVHQETPELYSEAGLFEDSSQDSSDVFERRLLQQDQVQHQMFMPHHNLKKDVEQLESVPSDVPLDLHQKMPLVLQQQLPVANQAMMRQQILAIYRLQALQALNAMAINQAMFPTTLLTYLPIQPTEEDTEENDAENSKETKSDLQAEHKTDYSYENADPEAIIVDAANSDEKTRFIQKPVLLRANLRLSLGDIISGIPWLPIEINVPDSIAWAYNGISNGISGIISIIGQWPNSRPSSKTGIQGSNVFVKQMMMQDPINPWIMVVPIRMNPQIAQLQ